jgi:hypothetical protein
LVVRRGCLRSVVGGSWYLVGPCVRFCIGDDCLWSSLRGSLSGLCDDRKAIKCLILGRILGRICRFAILDCFDCCFRGRGNLGVGHGLVSSGRFSRRGSTFLEFGSWCFFLVDSVFGCRLLGWRGSGLFINWSNRGDLGGGGLSRRSFDGNFDGSFDRGGFGRGGFGLNSSRFLDLFRLVSLCGGLFLNDRCRLDRGGCSRYLLLGLGILVSFGGGSRRLGGIGLVGRIILGCGLGRLLLRRRFSLRNSRLGGGLLSRHDRFGGSIVLGHVLNRKFGH